MFDIHTHVLPGLDDGPGSWDEAIELCRMAADDGTEGLVATPHIQKGGAYRNTAAVIKEKVVELRERLAGRVELELYWGADTHIATGLVEAIREGEVPTINDGNYLLLELPHDVLPPHVENLLFELRLAKITPVITHPERCGWAMRELGRIQRFVDMGALMQITAMSLTGGFGREARAMTKTLLERGLVHVIASDAHSIRTRPTGLSAAFREASSIVGEDEARKMVRDTPLEIIKGKDREKTL